MTANAQLGTFDHMTPGPMSGEEWTAYELGYKLGTLELDECSQIAIEGMYTAMREIYERNTVGPDHPGNMAGTDLAMIAGRLCAYDEFLTA